MLAISIRAGDTNIAVFSKPQVMKDGTSAFAMADRLTHANLQENPKAAFAFQEGRYKEVRIYLEKVREETAAPVRDGIRGRAQKTAGCGKGEEIQHLVLLRVLQHPPVVGCWDASGEEEFLGEA
ncbi:MAG: pyridoxamine 5'-phosphate oxidase family protein [Deltaproteobacteria bacterium]|nr:pyridoxamine 5'-phosphate oxidase family protein [Deltaproteobacteria bacterium]